MLEVDFKNDGHGGLVSAKAGRMLDSQAAGDKSNSVERWLDSLISRDPVFSSNHHIQRTVQYPCQVIYVLIFLRSLHTHNCFAER